MTNFVLFLLLITIIFTKAAELILETGFLGEPDLRFLHEVDDVCLRTREEIVQGTIHVQMVGRPGRITNGEIRSLQDALVSVYDRVASENCRMGYRNIVGARVNTISSNSTETQQFRMAFDVVAHCKGCSGDQRFFRASSGGRAQYRKLSGGKNRKLSSKREKGTKKSKHESAIERLGYDPLLSSRCICSPPSKGLFTVTLRHAVKNLFDEKKVLNIDVVNVADEVLSSDPPSFLENRFPTTNNGETLPAGDSSLDTPPKGNLSLILSSAPSQSTAIQTGQSPALQPNHLSNQKIANTMTKAPTESPSVQPTNLTQPPTMPLVKNTIAPTELPTVAPSELTNAPTIRPTEGTVDRVAYTSLSYLLTVHLSSNCVLFL